jgi:cell wall assembly regulator SMI1
LLDDLEEEVGQRLPDEYREYLLDQDGGRLENNSQALTSFFGLGDVPEYRSMRAKLETYRDRLPPWLLPIANDAFGNLFAISLRATDLGSIWFWDHEREADEGEPATEDNIELKAPGLLAFLESLQPAD